MEKQFVLEYKHYKFIVVYTSIVKPEIEESMVPSSYMRLDVFRKGMPEFWTWTGDLGAMSFVPFKLSLPDNVNIEGKFHLETLESRMFVFMYAYYGMPLDKTNYQGNIFQIEEPGPEREPDEYRTYTADAPNRPSETYIDIIPYLYLYGWPQNAAYDANKFITYVYKDQDNLYKAILNAPTRKQIQDYVTAFIASRDFIPSVGTLPPPFYLYPEIYDLLLASEIPREYIEFLPFFNERILPKEPVIGTMEEVPVTTTDIIDNVWQNLFALNATNEYRFLLQDALIKVIIVDKLLSYVSNVQEEQWKPEIFYSILNAHIVLPQDIFPLKPYTKPAETSTTEAVITGTILPFAVGDLQVLRYRHTGYQPGDIAHIENVLKGEIKKVRSRKSFVHEEQITSLVKDTSDSINDITESKFQQEIDNTLKQFTDTHQYKNFAPCGALNSGSLYVTNTLGTDGKPLTSPPSEMVKEFARSVVSRSVSRVAQMVYHKRELTMRHETHEEILHLLDNRDGVQNIRGIYRWLNKVYHVQLVSQHSKFLLEFLIDKTLWLNQYGQAILPPPDGATAYPAPPKYSDIATSNYLSLGLIYRADGLPTPPVSAKIVNGNLHKNGASLCINMPVPPGYVPDTITIFYNGDAGANVIAGVQQVQLTSGSPVAIPQPVAGTQDEDFESNAVPVVLIPDETATSWQVNIEMHCRLHPYTFEKWQIQVYDLLMKGYEKQLTAYKQPLQDSGGSSPANGNKMNSKIRSSVIRSSISLLWDIHLNLNDNLVQQPPARAVCRPEYQYFFRDTFDWEEMSYSAVGTAVAKDEIFDAISGVSQLVYEESGKIQVLLPVRSGNHFKALYYLSTGMISAGSDKLTPIVAKSMDIPVALEQLDRVPRSGEKRILDSWNVNIPTQMQWLQESGDLPFNT